MEKEFVPYKLAVKLKSLGFDEECFGFYNPTVTEKVIMNNDSYGGYGLSYEHIVVAPTFSQAINFLYIYSNKQIDIELKASETYEERLRKIDQGCEDLWNLQNSKSN